jgi:hypothetical protein
MWQMLRAASRRLITMVIRPLNYGVVVVRIPFAFAPASRGTGRLIAGDLADGRRRRPGAGAVRSQRPRFPPGEESDNGRLSGTSAADASTALLHGAQWPHLDSLARPHAWCEADSFVTMSYASTSGRRPLVRTLAVTESDHPAGATTRYLVHNVDSEEVAADLSAVARAARSVGSGHPLRRKAIGRTAPSLPGFRSSARAWSYGSGL